MTASWCPTHGDCTCPDDHDPADAGYGIKDLDDPSCPLHGHASAHAVTDDDEFVYVDEGWWHPNVKAGQVHLHPEHPGGGWSPTMHRQCEPVYTRRATS